MYKNGFVKLDDVDVSYVSFGKGDKVLIIIPGLGDGLKMVRGMGFYYSVLYKEFSKKYRVYLFSRRNTLKPLFSTEDMADDIFKVMNILKIAKADFIGISQGGMILQHLALKYPSKINKMVLAVTSARGNDILDRTITRWESLAKKNEFYKLSIDIFESSYSKKYLRWLKIIYPFVRVYSKSCDRDRFLIMADACIKHNVFDRLGEINISTLVIGALEDTVLGSEASKEIADKIVNSELFIYDNYGHGVYSEARDFKERVLNFFEEV